MRWGRGKGVEGGGGGTPDEASRCAYQRQLEPPGDTTRSESGVAESGWTGSCCVGKTRGRARRDLGMGEAWAK